MHGTAIKAPKGGIALLLTYMMTFITASAADGLMLLKRACSEMLDSQTCKRYSRRAAPEDTLCQLVLLISFSDCDFSQEDPNTFYNDMFNTSGYNLMDGPGCVADYFRDQSGEQLNLQFDIYGPVKVTGKVRNSSNEQITGRAAFYEAIGRLTTVCPDIDYSLYDWDGDKELEHVVIVYAGYAGNQTGLSGYIWPTTGSITPVKTADGYTIARYSASGELWANNTSCGIGTICHEYSHALGLPDLYPTSSEVSDFSIVDEWDLMDGGTATNRGWCPPNYSALERMILGWHQPKELTQDTIITGLKPVAEGGESFLIHHTDDEFYLLENRQQDGWDKGLPGRGLVIQHVNYNEFRWLSNTVNNVQDQPNYHIVAADGMTYTDWYNCIINRGLGNPYVDRTRRLNSLILSTAPYPWVSETGSAVRALTDTSQPATLMYNENSAGSRLLGHSVTDITQHQDGTVSFTFHANSLTAVDGVRRKGEGLRSQMAEGRCDIHDLQGRKANVYDLRKGVYIVSGRKVVAR